MTDPVTDPVTAPVSAPVSDPSGDAVVAPTARPFGPDSRLRIAPAPSGDLHVGNVRTALYNWALARRHGGTFIVRIEDTDRSRVTDEAFLAAQEVLRWVGLDWDEGPGVGGPHGPYRQSERLALYADAVERLLASGAAYRAFDTPEELAGQREQQRAQGRPQRYDGSRWRALDPRESAELAASGRSFVVRFAMPAGSTTWTDLVRGDITIDHREIADFTLTRSDGHPLYMLAATVDDVAMRLTHVVRGEDLIAATPRQMALYAALGHPREEWPAFGHLPLIVGEDHKPLSKRNGEVSLRWYRDHGFLPEAMLNYLALLGWSLAPDREVFTADEMVAAFDVARVSRNPARFDVRKLEALNGEHIRLLPVDELTRRLAPLVPDVPPDLLARAVPLARERMVRLTDAPQLLGFLGPGDLVVDEAAWAKALVPSALPVLTAASDVLAALPEWSLGGVEAGLRAAAEGQGLSFRKFQAPVRVALTGRAVGLPLFELVEILGRDRVLERLARAVADLAD